MRELAGCEGIELVDDPTPWQVEIIRPAAREAGEEKGAVHTRAAAPDPVLLKRLEERLAWRYPFEGETSIPAKLGVSAVGERKGGGSYRFHARPRFMSDRALTPAERGSAMHKFMQFSDYGRAREDVKAEADRMAAMGFLSPAEAGSLDLARLRDFFCGPLGKRIFAADALMRELRFLGRCGRELLGDYLEGMDGESKVALQGVADCVFIEGDGAVILDYKTDHVKTGEELLERYSLQLTLYREILTEVLPVPVKECLIYSFALGRALAVRK